ncbi:hypothetical protein F6R98_05735 [Candidatus Methylospira mobilis]|uniref:Tc1-like transposase DDE domain-containing protein n=1 Tax=Candidatus Methylospira mobilis TaxID=1808979 RepID=A0A5Q0BJ45_9GAMM|nr:hypothetical protein F6R98_05735 [Candidatus Methylospira mobilis]
MWMDNASIHHSIEQEITDRWLVDHRLVLLYLPPYSPELNLIEILCGSMPNTIGVTSLPGHGIR